MIKLQVNPIDPKSSIIFGVEHYTFSIFHFQQTNILKVSLDLKITLNVSK